MHFSKLLEKAGIKTESIFKIRLGKGVVGKTSSVACIALVTLGGVGFKLDTDWMKLLFGIGISFLVIFYLSKILKFAEKHPEQSLLEGSEIIQWRQMELATKELARPPEELIN